MTSRQTLQLKVGVIAVSLLLAPGLLAAAAEPPRLVLHEPGRH
ncbi:MAG: hypothetical protein V2J55_12885 [Candidatus Competibacteraceae bacterium]|nr:hypothetical protein [Candidatus Competibacteraceae bacterium]